MQDQRNVGPETAPQAPVPNLFWQPHFHVDEFLAPELAREMRAAVDRHFAEPYKQNASHQVWNYWYVPDMYTFMRTQPDKVIPQALVARFHRALTTWAWNALGLGYVTQPYLSLYVDGCSQSIHNDATNGRFGYVYSLTCDDRATRGGETIVFHEGDPYRQNLTRMTGGRGGLYELMEPKFNRLALFDDRMPHGVRPIEGSMDPVEGRIVLHGHISEAGAAIRGPLSETDVTAVVTEAAAEALDGFDLSSPPHGPMSVRLRIGADGKVEHGTVLLDRIASPDGASCAGMAAAILEAVRKAAFPAAAQPSEAIVPITVGGPLPWMVRK